MTAPAFIPGQKMALAQSAVNERVADDPRTVDWFGVIQVLTQAHIADLDAGRDRQ